jgi:hypothetical protein
MSKKGINLCPRQGKRHSHGPVQRSHPDVLAGSHIGMQVVVHLQRLLSDGRGLRGGLGLQELTHSSKRSNTITGTSMSKKWGKSVPMPQQKDIPALHLNAAIRSSSTAPTLRLGEKWALGKRANSEF